VVLLEAWKAFEVEQGSAEDVQKVQEMMPKVMKKWRQAEDGSGLEECTSLALCPLFERIAHLALLRIYRLGHGLCRRRKGGEPRELQVLPGRARMVQEPWQLGFG
jgi:hypothetical protein